MKINNTLLCLRTSVPLFPLLAKEKYYWHFMGLFASVGAHFLVFVIKRAKGNTMLILQFPNTNELSPTHRKDSFPTHSECRKVIYAGFGDMIADRTALFQTMKSSCNGCKKKWIQRRMFCGCGVLKKNPGFCMTYSYVRYFTVL